MNRVQVKTIYTIRCARCPNSAEWTKAASVADAIRMTRESDWEERPDGLICFECVYREGHKEVEPGEGDQAPGSGPSAPVLV